MLHILFCDSWHVDGTFSRSRLRLRPIALHRPRPKGKLLHTMEESSTADAFRHRASKPDLNPAIFKMQAAAPYDLRREPNPRDLNEDVSDVARARRTSRSPPNRAGSVRRSTRASLDMKRIFKLEQQLRLRGLSGSNTQALVSPRRDNLRRLVKFLAVAATTALTVRAELANQARVTPSHAPSAERGHRPRQKRSTARPSSFGNTNRMKTPFRFSPRRGARE